eukprot:3522400-Rhodomonas_salina.1
MAVWTSRDSRAAMRSAAHASAVSRSSAICPRVAERGGEGAEQRKAGGGRGREGWGKQSERGRTRERARATKQNERGKGGGTVLLDEANETKTAPRHQNTAAHADSDLVGLVEPADGNSLLELDLVGGPALRDAREGRVRRERQRLHHPVRRLRESPARTAVTHSQRLHAARKGQVACRFRAPRKRARVLEWQHVGMAFKHGEPPLGQHKEEESQRARHARAGLG